MQEIRENFIFIAAKIKSAIESKSIKFSLLKQQLDVLLRAIHREWVPINAEMVLEAMAAGIRVLAEAGYGNTAKFYLQQISAAIKHKKMQKPAIDELDADLTMRGLLRKGDLEVEKLEFIELADLRNALMKFWRAWHESSHSKDEESVARCQQITNKLHALEAQYYYTVLHEFLTARQLSSENGQALWQLFSRLMTNLLYTENNQAYAWDFIYTLYMQDIVPQEYFAELAAYLKSACYRLNSETYQSKSEQINPFWVEYRRHLEKYRTDFAEKVAVIPDNLAHSFKQWVSIQKEFNQNIVEFIQQRIAACELWLGTAPIGYSLVGMGSIARGEFQLHSDIECMLLLQTDTAAAWEEVTDKHAIYFKAFYALFQYMIMSLGERRGFSLDEGVHPDTLEKADDGSAIAQQLRGTPATIIQHWSVRPMDDRLSYMQLTVIDLGSNVQGKELLGDYIKSFATNDINIASIKARAREFILQAKRKITAVSKLPKNTADLKHDYLQFLTFSLLHLAKLHGLKADNFPDIVAFMLYPNSSCYLDAQWLQSLMQEYVFLQRLRFDFQFKNYEQLEEVFLPNIAIANIKQQLTIGQYDRLQKLRSNILLPFYQTLSLSPSANVYSPFFSYWQLLIQNYLAADLQAKLIFTAMAATVASLNLSVTEHFYYYLPLPPELRNIYWLALSQQKLAPQLMHCFEALLPVRSDNEQQLCLQLGRKELPFDISELNERYDWLLLLSLYLVLSTRHSDLNEKNINLRSNIEKYYARPLGFLLAVLQYAYSPGNAEILGLLPNLNELIPSANNIVELLLQILLFLKQQQNGSGLQNSPLNMALWDLIEVGVMRPLTELFLDYQKYFNNLFKPEFKSVCEELLGNLYNEFTDFYLKWYEKYSQLLCQDDYKSLLAHPIVNLKDLHALAEKLQENSVASVVEGSKEGSLVLNLNAASIENSELVKYIQNIRNLQRLKIHGLPKVNRNLWCKLIVEIMKNNKEIQFLDLGNNHLEDDCFKMILDQGMAVHLKDIADLHLNNNKLTGIGFSYLADLLKTDNKLVNLVLGGNFITNIAQSIGSIQASSQQRKLTYLSFSGNPLTEKDLQALAQLLLSVKNPLALSSLSLAGIDLKGQRIQPVLNMLGCSSLLMLYLDACQLTDIEIAQLAQALANHREKTQLGRLSLNDNKFTLKGMAALNDVIMKGKNTLLKNYWEKFSKDFMPYKQAVIDLFPKLINMKLLTQDERLKLESKLDALRQDLELFKASLERTMIYWPEKKDELWQLYTNYSCIYDPILQDADCPPVYSTNADELKQFDKQIIKECRNLSASTKAADLQLFRFYSQLVKLIADLQSLKKLSLNTLKYVHAYYAGKKYKGLSWQDISLNQAGRHLFSFFNKQTLSVAVRVCKQWQAIPAEKQFKP